MNFFDIQNTAFEIIGYHISYAELIGTLFGIISVYLASRANILTWSTGIVNLTFLFILFYQVQLYADMFLQVYFFILTIYGWYNWHNRTEEKKISELTQETKIILIATIICGTVTGGFFFENIHLYFPEYFKVRAAYPFADSFVMVSSIIATILLAKKKIENWVLWITIDVVCTFLYFQKSVYFLSLEYLIFLGLASYGLYNWNKQLRHD